MDWRLGSTTKNLLAKNAKSQKYSEAPQSSKKLYFSYQTTVLGYYLHHCDVTNAVTLHMNKKVIQRLWCFTVFFILSVFVSEL